MIFSTACEYGIRATIYIAHQSKLGVRPNLKDISKEIDSPEAFTAKILQMLVKSEILTSTKGAFGGFGMEEKRQKKIKLFTIVTAIDGDDFSKICVIGMKKCSEKHPCPVHHKYKFIKQDMIDMLKETSLFELSTNFSQGLSCLKLEN